MFSFIFFILFLAVLFIFIIGGSIIRGILNLLFGRRSLFGQYSAQRPHSQSQTHQQQSNTTNKTQQTSSKKRNKVFDASDGEYVDFEEIRD